MSTPFASNDNVAARAEQADRDRETQRLDGLEAGLGMAPFTAPASVVTYDVLYNVPVPGLEITAMATEIVSVGPLAGDPLRRYTTVADIPNIIEIMHGYRTGAVTVVKIETIR